ncbi:EAL domain-containing protein, partial [Shewanella sp. 0m-11]
VQNLHCEQGVNLCKAVIQLAQTLKISFIVEGIETRQQRDLLLTIGNGMGQGYYFGKPTTCERFSLETLKSITREDSLPQACGG